MSTEVWYFLIIMGACTLFFVFSLFEGDESHGVHAENSLGAHHGHDHVTGGDHGVDNISKDGFREIFSIRNLMMFGVGFGAAGAASVASGAGLWLAVPFAAVIGVIVAYVAMIALRFLMSQESSTDSSLLSLVGETGRVTTAISSNGVGEIVLNNFRGEPVHLIVRSEDGLAIQSGTEVQLVSIDGVTTGVVRDVKKIPSGSSW